MRTIVEMRNVAAWRGDTRVFQDLSLELHLGCSTAILGPNGAGKTTLLKLLSREVHPEHRDGSTMRLFGRERWNVWDLRSRLGIVSHDLHRAHSGRARGRDVILSGYVSTPRVWPHHQFTDAQRQRASEIIEHLGIAGLGERRYAEMSSGEQRRFLLGRALVHDPEVLVLDEPTSGLDPKACFQYLDIVRRLMRAGKTVVLVTHHIHEIPPEITRVLLLKNGGVLRDGEKTEVLTAPDLSTLFDTPIDIVRANGYFRVVPGERSG